MRYPRRRFLIPQKNNYVPPPKKSQNNVDRATETIYHAYNQGGDNCGNNDTSDDRNDNGI